MTKPTNDKEKLMRMISEEGFAVEEARLYLDTHPNDKKAGAYFDKHLEAYKKAMSVYQSLYGALTSDAVNVTKNGWTWATTPFPWDEKED